MEKTVQDVKKYWDDRPCNIRHSPKSIGSLEFFEESKQRKFFVEPHIKEFANYKEWKDKNVLEIGCGLGCESIEFALAGANLTSIDLSDKSLNIARQRALVYKAINIQFVQADAEHLSDSIPPRIFDLIYSFGVLHHTPKPEMAFSEIKKYMNKDTLLKIMVYHKISWRVLWILLSYGKGAFWRINELIAHYSEAQEGCPVTYAYTKKSIKQLLTDFDILDIKIDHIFSYFIPEYKKYQYKTVWYFKWIPKKIFKLFEQKFGWHMMVTAKLK